jgi:hypothetical protein
VGAKAQSECINYTPECQNRGAFKAGANAGSLHPALPVDFFVPSPIGLLLLRLIFDRPLAFWRKIGKNGGTAGTIRGWKCVVILERNGKFTIGLIPGRLQVWQTQKARRGFPARSRF